MLCIAGTVPADDFPLMEGEVELIGEKLRIGTSLIAVNRGTPALMAAALKATETLGRPLPFAYLVGDTGTGKGSRRLYAHMTDDLPRRGFDAITFHYLQPIIYWHKKIRPSSGR